MANLKIHPSNLIYVIICILGVVVFALVGIYPNSAAMESLEADIAELNKKVQTQELLFPVYQKLIKEVTQKIPSKLPLPDKSQSTQNDLGRINEIFSKLADESDVIFSSATPDAVSYLEDQENLTMNVNFSGDFFKLRKLLLSVCRLPYLGVIEEMRLETDQGKKRLSFKLKLKQ
jgi:hypothetical protein